LVRTRTSEVSCLGRNTQGVTLIKVAKGENLIGVERVCEPEGDEEASGELLDSEVESDNGADNQQEAGEE